MKFSLSIDNILRVRPVQSNSNGLNISAFLLRRHLQHCTRKQSFKSHQTKAKQSKVQQKNNKHPIKPTKIRDSTGNPLHGKFRIL